MITSITRKARPQVITLGTCLLVLLAACGRAEPAAGPPPLGPLPTVRTDADIVLPLDRYTLDWHDRIVLETAREQLGARCQAALGLPGYPVSDLRPYALQPRHGNVFGLYSEQVARQDGLRPAWVSALDRQGRDTIRRFAPWSGPRVQFALHGSDASPSRASPSARATAPSRAPRFNRTVPRGGCAAQSFRALYGLSAAKPIDSYWLGNLQGQAVRDSSRDARLVPAAAAWTKCMTAAGYPGSSPGGFSDDPGLVRASGTAQRKAALADVRCTWSSRFVDTWVALTAAYEQRQVATNRARLLRDYTLRITVLRAVHEHGLGRLGGTYGSPPPS